MSQERLVNLVLMSIDEEGPEARAEFIVKMSKGFGIPPDQLEKILESLPFVLSRKCTLDEARGMAEKVQDAGGICRLQDPSEEEASQPPAAPAQPQEAPAPEPPSPEPAVTTSAFDTMDSDPNTQEAPEGADVPSIPLATGGGGGVAAGGKAPSAGEVKCIECGEVQPKGETCRTCFFPLPNK